MLSGRLLRCLVLLALVACLALAQGCGSDSTPPPPSAGAAATQSGAAPAISEAEVERYEAGTAEHTVLEWWRAVQLNEPETALPLYAEEPTLPNLAGQFNYVAGKLAGGVKVASVKKTGDDAIVTVAWRKPGAQARKVTIGMEREGGEWKIATVRFLDNLVAQLQKAEAAAASG